MKKEMRSDVDKTTRSLITELIIKTHNNEIKIPEAVDKILNLMKTDTVEKENKTPIVKNVDPLFEKGTLPVDELNHWVIQEIQQMSNGNYRYFIYDKYNTYGSGWLTEDELIDKITKTKQKE